MASALEIWVVGYWNNVYLITANREQADRECERLMGAYSQLPWGVRAIDQAIQHSYEAGCDDGRRDCEED